MERNHQAAAKSVSVVLSLLFALFTFCEYAAAADSTACVGRLTVGAGENRTDFELTAHRVSVKIDDQIAVTQIEQVFRNPTDKTLPALYSCVVPSDATLIGFARKTPSGYTQAQLVPYMEYNNEHKMMNVPGRRSLLDPPEFQAVVADIDSGDSVTLRCTWIQTLTASNGAISYSCNLPAGENVSVNAQIRSSAPMDELVCPSHKRSLMTDGSVGNISIANAADVPAFSLQWKLADQPAELAASKAFYVAAYHPEGKDGYFVANISAEAVLPAAPPELNDQVPANLLFMVDTSASMSGDKLEAAKQVMRAILDERTENDRFNILTCDVTSKLLFPEFFDNLPAFRDLTLDQFNPVLALGASDLASSCQAAAKELTTACKEHPLPRTEVIYIGDGCPTFGETDVPAILKAAAEAFEPLKLKASAVGIGYDCDHDFLDAFARAFGGFSYYYSRSTAEEISARMTARSTRSVACDLVLQAQGLEVYDLYPSVVPNLAAGERTLIVGRFKGQGTMSLLSGDKQISAKLFVSNNDLIAKEWTRRKMNDLSASAARGDADAARRVVEISCASGIDSPCTEFQLDQTKEGGMQSGPRFIANQWEDVNRQPQIKYWGYIFSYLPVSSRRMMLDEQLAGVNSSGRGADSAGAGKLTLDDLLTCCFVQPPADAIAVRPDSGKSKTGIPAGWYWGRGKPMNLTYDLIIRSYGSGGVSRNGCIYNREYLFDHLEKKSLNLDKIAPEVRNRLKAYIHDDMNYFVRYERTSCDTNGKEISRETATVTKIKNKFNSLRNTSNSGTHRELCDGTLFYRYDAEARYASARAARPLDESFSREMYPFSSLDIFSRADKVRFEDLTDDTAAIIADLEDGGCWIFVADTRRKVLLELNQYVRNNRLANGNGYGLQAAADSKLLPARLIDSGMELASRTIFDQFKTVNGIVIPTCARRLNRSSTINERIIIKDVKLGDFETKVEFVPPAGTMVVVYPLPGMEEARKKAEAEDTDSAQLTLAFALEEKGRYSEAVAVAKKLLARRPNDYTLHLYVGWLEVLDGDRTAFSRAVTEAAELLVKDNPDQIHDDGAQSPRYLFYCDVADTAKKLRFPARQQIRYQRALLDAARQGSYEYASAAYALAIAYDNYKKHDAAVALWDKVLADAPQSPQLLILAARFYSLHQETYSKAEELYCRAEKSGWSVGHSLAKLYLKMGRHSEAKTEYRQLVESPASKFNDYFRSIATISGNEAACAEAERMIAEAKNDEQRNWYLSRYCSFLSRYYPDRKRLEKVCKQLTRAHYALRSVCGAFLQSKSRYNPFPEIQKIFEKRPADYAEYCDRLNLLNEISNSRKETQGLLAALEKADVEIPADKKTYTLLLLARIRRTIDPASAKETYQKVLAVDSATDGDLQEAYSGLCRYELDQGNVEAAVDMFLKSARLDKTNVSTAYHLSEIYKIIMQKERYDLLKPIGTQIEQALPDYQPYVRALSAGVLYQQGKKLQCCEVLQDLLLDLDEALTSGKMLRGDDDEWFSQIGKQLVNVAAINTEVADEVDRWTDKNSKVDSERWAELRVEFLMKQRKLGQLAEFLQKMMASNAERMKWARTYGAVCAARGNYESATEAYERILENRPDDLGLLAEISRVAYAAGDVAKSREYWNRWMKAVPDNTLYLQQVRWKLTENDSNYQCMDVLERMSAIYKEEGCSNPYGEKLAEIYKSMGREFDAAMVYLDSVRSANNGTGRISLAIAATVNGYLKDDAVFDQFVFSMEKYRANADDPVWKARLTTAMAELYHQRKMERQAEQLATAALEMQYLDFDGGETALDILDKITPEADRHARLLEIARQAPDGGSLPLQMRLIRDLFNAGNTADAQKKLAKVKKAFGLDKTVEYILPLAKHVVQKDHAAALVLLDDAANESDAQQKAMILLNKAELMAVTDGIPHKDVVAAFRAAEELGSYQAPIASSISDYISSSYLSSRNGPIFSKQQVLKKLFDFACKAELPDVAFEVCDELAELDEDTIPSSIKDMGKYLQDHNMVEKAAPKLLELANRAEAGYRRSRIIVEIGDIFVRAGQADRAISMIFNQLAKEHQPEFSPLVNGDSTLLDSVSSLITRNYDAIDPQKAADLMLDYVNKCLADKDMKSYEWSNSYSFVYAIQRLNLVEKLIDVFQALPPDKPEYAQHYLAIASFYEKLEQPVDALCYCKMALPNTTGYEKNMVLGRMAKLYEQTEDFEDALKYLDQIISENTGDLTRMRLLAKLGRTKEALAEGRKVSSLTRSIGQHYTMAQEALKLGMDDFAMDEMLIGLQSSYGNNGQYYVPQYYKGIADVCLKRGDATRAMKVLLIGTKRAEANRNSALSYQVEQLIRETPDADALVRAYEDAVSESGIDSAKIRFTIGNFYRQKNQNDKALEHYRKAGELDPYDQETWVQCSYVIPHIAEPTKKRRAIAAYLVHVPYNDYFYGREIGRAKNDGHKDEALRMATTPLDVRPGKARCYTSVAQNLKYLDRANDVIEMYRQAIKLDPDDLSSYSLLATAYTQNNQKDEAIRILEQMLQHEWPKRAGVSKDSIRRRIEWLKR